MSFPTPVNSQITDSVSQANVSTLGVAPAVATGELLQATSQSLANVAHNAALAQQQANILGQAAAAQGVALLYAAASAAEASPK